MQLFIKVERIFIELGRKPGPDAGHLLRDDGRAVLKIHNNLDNIQPQHHKYTMLVSLTVGKVDAGVAVLLTEDKRLVCINACP